MKAKPLKFDGVKTYSPCSPGEATHVSLRMPGPFYYRMIPVILKGSRSGTGCWSWNGDTEKPTLKPSISTRGTRELTDEEIKKIHEGGEVEPKEVVCHTWVNDGKVIFLDDCTHELAGKTLDLLDID